jgi:hypothetical protein
VLGSGSHLGVNRTQIDVPAPFADVVGVTDGVSELRPLAADITNSCHNSKFLPGLLPKHQFYRNSENFAKAKSEVKGQIAEVKPVGIGFWDFNLCNLTSDL